MSQMAQALQKQIDELRKAQRTGRRPKVVEDDPLAGGEVEDVTEPVGTAQPPHESATEQQQEAPMTQKNTKTATKKKAAKAATKADGSAARKQRSKVIASGAIVSVESAGKTYLTLAFDEGQITLTPTGNREQNRDLAVAAIKKLLKA